MKPEAGSNEERQVLHLERITNHPNYSPGTVEDKWADLKGPYAGGDIAERSFEEYLHIWKTLFCRT